MAPDGLLAAIELFIDAFHMQLLEMTEQTWQNNKQGLLNQLTEADANLRARESTTVGAVLVVGIFFPSKRKAAAALMEISRADFIALFALCVHRWQTEW